MVCVSVGTLSCRGEDGCFQEDVHCHRVPGPEPCTGPMEVHRAQGRAPVPGRCTGPKAVHRAQGCAPGPGPCTGPRAVHRAPNRAPWKIDSILLHERKAQTWDGNSSIIYATYPVEGHRGWGGWSSTVCMPLDWEEAGENPQRHKEIQTSNLRGHNTPHQKTILPWKYEIWEHINWSLQQSFSSFTSSLLWVYLSKLIKQLCASYQIMIV